ncbi:hypothetical protein FHR75_001479 [Kineococcus radiotolerans]|uniref:DUF998 domain-containing protein n=1 Tax=Kineococcus radiotolerans TaxID=131568 RepID=A0A7W4XW56_KINRA|nr:DUF998 domain-containing protein [Kineococcus radiotolerans]MBB2900691.1 hypothetical protein [Kineococcus radiotolerans]
MRTRVALATAAALANANFLLAPLVGARVDLATGVISELSVAGQPGAAWFRLGDGAAGVLCALLALPPAREAVRRARFRALCLGVFGLTTLVSALVPLTCVPSLGPCPAPGGADVVHDAVSVLGTLAAVLGALALLRHARGGLRPLAALAALGSAGTGAYQVVTFLQGGDGGGGAAQRLQVLAVSLWVVLEVVSRRERAQRGRYRAASTSP